MNYEAFAPIFENFNKADMCNVCKEAVMFTIRADRDYVL